MRAADTPLISCCPFHSQAGSLARVTCYSMGGPHVFGIQVKGEQVPVDLAKNMLLHWQRAVRQPAAACTIPHPGRPSPHGLSPCVYSFAGSRGRQVPALRIPYQAVRAAATSLPVASSPCRNASGADGAPEQPPHERPQHAACHRARGGPQGHRSVRSSIELT